MTVNLCKINSMSNKSAYAKQVVMYFFKPALEYYARKHELC